MKNLFKVVTIFATLALLVGSMVALSVSAAEGDLFGETDATATATAVESTGTEATSEATEATEATGTEATEATEPSEATGTEATEATEPSEATGAETTGTEAAEVKAGDANADGLINMKDVLTIRKYLADMEVVIDLDGADAYADGEVNTKDVLALRQYLAGIIDVLPMTVEPTTAA